MIRWQFSGGEVPKPIRADQRYMPGLDGLRALAVLAVIAYHLGLGWAQGGMLGVGVFFTLSGYLITDLLLGQWEATGRLRLGDFWLRRARRLLPALFVMLTVVAAWVTLLDRPSLPALRGDVAAAAGYVSNWWLITQHSSYFARFGPPSPLGHLWSLAVEEQFYLAWPWLALLGLYWARRRGWPLGGRRRLAALTMLLAAASATAMALAYQPGHDPTRVYEGTDTRAFGLLIGAALAFVWPGSRLRADISDRGRAILEGAGIAGLAVIGLLIWRTSQYSAFLYPAGMLLLSVAAASVVAAAASPATRVGRLLGWRPLRWVGVRSYGIYLWHYPIIVLTSPVDGHEGVARSAAQVAASIGVAALSWRFVEEPVRRGAIGRWWGEFSSDRLWGLSSRGWAAVTGATAVTVVAGMGLTGAAQPAPAGPATSPAGSISGTLALPGGGSRRAASLHAAGGWRGTGSRPLRTSCRAVVHIGDSTSEGLVSPGYLPDPSQRLPAQYAQVGVSTFYPEISGARSIYPETYEGQPNGYMVARQLVRHGYHGCWVLALGTNDAADISIGANVGMAARIRRMMSVIGNEPVLWVNVISLLSSGPYAESNMQQWNRALLRARARYPDMRVYNWAAAVRRDWFISDGVHYTSAGYAARAHLIANALAEAFPYRSRPRPPGRRPHPRGSRPGRRQTAGGGQPRHRDPPVPRLLNRRWHPGPGQGLALGAEASPGAALDRAGA